MRSNWPLVLPGPPRAGRERKVVGVWFVCLVFLCRAHVLLLCVCVGPSAVVLHVGRRGVMMQKLLLSVPNSKSLDSGS